MVLQVRMITQEFSREVNRWTAEALVAVQEVSRLFSKAYASSIYASLLPCPRKKSIYVFKSLHAFSFLCLMVCDLLLVLSSPLVLFSSVMQFLIRNGNTEVHNTQTKENKHEEQPTLSLSSHQKQNVPNSMQGTPTKKQQSYHPD